MTEEDEAVIVIGMNTMTANREATALRCKINTIQATGKLSSIPSPPTPVPYGHVYVATIIVGGDAFSEVFKFNRHTYESDMKDDMLLTLLRKAQLVPDEVTHAELLEYSLSYVLQYGTENPDFIQGVEVTGDTNYRIHASAIRVGKKGAKRTSTPQWDTLKHDVTISINAVDTWLSESVDTMNLNAMNDWVDNTVTQIQSVIDALCGIRESVLALK